MLSAEAVRDDAALWDIAVPAGPSSLAGVDVPAGRHPLPGVAMAGFRHRRALGPVDLRPLPTPSVMVVVEFGSGSLVVDTPEGSQRGSLVAGLTPGDVRARGEGIECVQIRLPPPIAGAVLGASPAELNATTVGLADLWGRDAAHLEEQLHEAASWPERFAAVEAALGRRYGSGPLAEPETLRAWELIVGRRGQVRVDDLAEDTGWSRKRLWSRFRAQIGLPPKRAARLARFDHAVHRLAAGISPSQVAAEGGYADQSHLHRDVLAFAGTTPTAAARAPWLAVDDVAWPDR